MDLAYNEAFRWTSVSIDATHKSCSGNLPSEKYFLMLGQRQHPMQTPHNRSSFELRRRSVRDITAIFIDVSLLITFIGFCSRL